MTEDLGRHRVRGAARNHRRAPIVELRLEWRRSVADASEQFTKPNIADDRAEFEAERRRNCLALGADAAMFEQALDCVDERRPSPLHLPVVVDGRADHPDAARHRRDAGDHLEDQARRRHRDRRRARRFGDFLRFDAGADRQRQGRRRRHRHSRPQSRHDRKASDGEPHHVDRGLVDRPGDDRAGESRNSRRRRVMLVLDSDHSKSSCSGRIARPFPVGHRQGNF